MEPYRDGQGQYTPYGSWQGPILARFSWVQVSLAFEATLGLIGFSGKHPD